jgi:hypothetical protein
MSLEGMRRKTDVDAYIRQMARPEPTVKLSPGRNG